MPDRLLHVVQHWSLQLAKGSCTLEDKLHAVAHTVGNGTHKPVTEGREGAVELLCFFKKHSVSSISSWLQGHLSPFIVHWLLWWYCPLLVQHTRLRGCHVLTVHHRWGLHRRIWWVVWLPSGCGLLLPKRCVLAGHRRLRFQRRRSAEAARGVDLPRRLLHAVRPQRLAPHLGGRQLLRVARVPREERLRRPDPRRLRLRIQRLEVAGAVELLAGEGALIGLCGGKVRRHP
mmetsp:Transcript_25839/g.80592  ORF Transcript_25839/g.80592 Transcript_25839/m.80592 type:complete len:231 (-) Transcript_25839:46-738(-)